MLSVPEGEGASLSCLLIIIEKRLIRINSVHMYIKDSFFSCDELRMSDVICDNCISGSQISYLYT